MPNTFYLDYENGNDAADGSTFSLGGLPSTGPWKTITSGATAARIAPGDVIRIAKSPAPASIGNGTWTNASKTVTLATGQNATIDNCETAWTANGAGDTTVQRAATSPVMKQGSYRMRFTLDASPQTSIMQAYYATGTLNLSAYQKITFWIYNSAAISANQWTITLCSDTAGATPVDTFAIPEITSTARWVPLTLARNGGGNLGSSIQSIAVNTGSSAPTNSSNISLDNISACTTSGLNLQSLISKNSAEQGGTEGWYGLKSIVTTTLILDTDTNQSASSGRGYGGATETVTTYCRETIKTAMAASGSAVVQEMQDNGTLAGGNIEFQGGYNTSSGTQDGETFFDGLNGNGYGLQMSSRSFITLNYISVCRYNNGIYITSSSNIAITTLSNAINCTNSGLVYSSAYTCTATTIGNINNNNFYGLSFSGSANIVITTLGNASNNGSYGVSFLNSFGCIIVTATANNNAAQGIGFSFANNCQIITLNTANNVTSGVSCDKGEGLVGSATIVESVKVANFTAFADARCYIQSIGDAANIWCDYGNIVSQAATAGGTGIEWKISITNAARAVNYPLKFKLAEVACAASAQVTVTCYFKKSHASDIAASLVTPGNELSGVSQTTTTCPSDTSRNQLQIQFTPSAAGVVTIEAWAWWVANTADENVIIDDIAVTQA